MNDAQHTTARKVLDALERLAQARRAFSQHMAGRRGLSPLQARLLGTLARGAPPEPNVGLLARELDLAQPTVTDAVAGLERKGLVVRAPDPTDRRRSRLCPTARGRRVADELAAEDEVLANALRPMSATELETVLESLLVIIERLHRAGFITVARTCTTCRFHRRTRAGHHCELLGIRLAGSDLQVDCPDHQP